jgi:hypothetical protein
MARTCPQCRQTYEESITCPRCLVGLVGVGWTHRSALSDDPLPRHWTRDPWVRVVLGVLLAQGTFFGLRSIFWSLALLSTGEADWLLGSLAGLLCVQVVQGLGLLIGSMLSGAGQRGGGLYGSFVGVWNGVVSMVIHGLQGEPITPVLLYSLPLIHAAVGAGGGIVGSWIWRPPSWSAEDQPPVLPRLSSSLFSLTRARIHPARVLLGCFVAAAGCVGADTLLQLALKTAEGHLTLRASMQHTLLTLEISALAVFVGGALAGATTWHGAAQGAWVGLLTAAALLGYQLGYRQTWDLETLLLYTAGILCLALLGGSFGGRLLPPLAPATPPSLRA